VYRFESDRGYGKDNIMAMYRKTALIEAYHYPFTDNVPQDFRDAIQPDEYGRLSVCTLEGDSYIVDDCWIAKGTHGEFWRIDNDVFRESYEEVQ
jgi:hypothetical protein